MAGLAAVDEGEPVHPEARGRGDVECASAAVGDVVVEALHGAVEGGEVRGALAEGEAELAVVAAADAGG